MAVEAPEITAEQLREQTLDWLREPAAGLDASGGQRRRREGLGAAARSRHAEWCVRFGEAGYATPTWPKEDGAGLSSLAQAKSSTRCSTNTECRPFNIIGIDGRPPSSRGGEEQRRVCCDRWRPTGDLVPDVQRARRRLRRRRLVDAGRFATETSGS
jgi:alkylation response protein AidB-like acyl-CoA dehydrogenase